MKSIHVALLLAAALLAACEPLPPRETGPQGPGTAPAAPRKPPPPGGWTHNAEQVSGPAVVALLNQARGEPPQQAAASLERGLRIEPRNPFLWQALAGTRLKQNMAEDAESAAQKSNSLAGGNPYIEVENWRTIASARRARGDETGAQDADQKAAACQGQLGN